MPTVVAGNSIDHPPRRMEPPWPADVASPRRPEIDLLRVVAMVSVFAAHAAEPFNPWDAWLVQSTERSKGLGELVLFLAPWVMPLFILLAGASAWHSLRKRSASAYLNERVTRLITPFAAGILLLVPPQVYMDRRQRGLFDGSYLEFYPRFFEGVYPEGNFTLAHFWFLGMLAVLAAITLPLFRWLRGAAGRRALARLARVCAPPGAILLLVLPMLAVRATLSAAFPQSPFIVTDWTNRTVLLPMIVYGYILAGDPALARTVDRQWKLLLGVAVGFSTAMFAWAWPGNMTDRIPAPFSPGYLVFWSAYTLGGLAWSVALFGAARAVSRGETRVIPHVIAHVIARVSTHARTLLNPFYMLHQTVIVVLAFYLVRARAGPIMTFLLLVVGAFLLTSTLSALVPRSRVTRVLFGVPAAAPAASASRGS